MKCLKDMLSISHPLPLAAVKVTATGTTIDFANIEANVIEFNFGVLTDGVITPSLVDSPDGVTFSPVAPTSIIGLLAPAAGNVSQKIAYDGPNRYVRPVLTVTGAPQTGIIAGVNVITKPRKLPAP